MVLEIAALSIHIIQTTAHDSLPNKLNGGIWAVYQTPIIHRIVRVGRHARVLKQEIDIKGQGKSNFTPLHAAVSLFNTLRG